MKKHLTKKICVFLAFVMTGMLSALTVGASDVEMLPIESINSPGWDKDSASLKFYYAGRYVTIPKDRYDIDSVLDIFSDNNLVYVNPYSDLPGKDQNGNEFSDTGYLVLQDTNGDDWQFRFNEDGVLVWARPNVTIFDDGSDEKTMEQGFFTYKDKSVYYEFADFICDIAVEEEEKYQQELDKITMYNIKILYQGSFDFDKMILALDRVHWGIVSYTRTPEDKDPIIAAYFPQSAYHDLFDFSYNCKDNILSLIHI